MATSLAPIGAMTMKTLSYTIVLEPAEEGGYNITVPALPGCVTQAETYEEALEMAKDAIELWIETLAEDGETIPEEPPSYKVAVGHVQVTAPMAV
jgi:predicted RNase H-like HicB family nuclease